MFDSKIPRVIRNVVIAGLIPLGFSVAPTVGSAAEIQDTVFERALAEDEQRLMSYLKAGNWDAIVEEAKGQSVNWWMWSGDAAVNRYADQWVAGQVKEMYDINLKFVPIKDTVEGVNQVVSEKNAGRHTGGSVDLNWISGENFATLMQGEALFVNWPMRVPNAEYIDFTDPTISHHGQKYIGNNSIAWSRYQYVLAYNSDNVDVPDVFSWQGLFDWCMANPGKFTYPAPPHFTGRGILFSLLYELSGDPNIWQGEFDQALWDQWSPKMWNFLNDMEPCLWRRGETYPESSANQEQLFGAGEIDWTITAYFATPGRNVDKGLFPKSTRTTVIDIGTISGTGVVGIPYNSSSKAAALVVANFLASPEAQYQKALPTGVADGIILDLNKMSAEWQEKFANLPRHEATLPFAILGAHQAPYGSEYLLPLERDWKKYVLKN